MAKKSYPLIQYHGLVMGSNQSWIDAEIRRAQRDNAPADAWAYIESDKRWATIDSCTTDYKPRLQKAWDKACAEKSTKNDS